MNKDRIEVGDTVDIFWPDGDVCLENGLILAVGDMYQCPWIIRGPDGRLSYVQQFEMMTLVKKGG